MQMKKVLFGLVLLLGLSGCTQPLPSDTLDEDSTVPITTPDATPPEASPETTDDDLPYGKRLEANVEAWGLGHDLITYVSNDRPWDWYVDQIDSGPFYDVNCGPAAVEMIGRWLAEDFSGSAQSLREQFRPAGGWWYGPEIEGALDLHEIAYETYAVSDAEDIMHWLDIGHILLINNTMSLIPYQEDETSRVNRFYRDWVSGHFLVIHGYVETDEGVYFEVNDPYNLRKTYDDGTPKGMNRYYEETVLIASILSWWPGVFVIYEAQ